MHGWNNGLQGYLPHAIGYGFNWIGLLYGLALASLLAVSIMTLVKVWNVRKTAEVPADDGAAGVLRERYARGEIGEAEFDSMRKKLDS